tara:strand:- start:64510 stop:65088 length:579 start_codon:yes stop_codon:yes gene_type:complete
MVRNILGVLCITIAGCAVPTEQRIETPSAYQELNQLENLTHTRTEALEYPSDIEAKIKAARVVRKRYDHNFELYEEVHVGSEDTNKGQLPLAERGDELYILLDTETVFKIRDAVISARENGKLVEKLDRILELSVEERNQVLRMLKLEYAHTRRMQEFNKYYQDELKRQATENQIDSITWRIIAVLSLVVAI